MPNLSISNPDTKFGNPSIPFIPTVLANNVEVSVRQNKSQGPKNNGIYSEIEIVLMSTFETVLRYNSTFKGLHITMHCNG